MFIHIISIEVHAKQHDGKYNYQQTLLAGGVLVVRAT